MEETITLTKTQAMKLILALDQMVTLAKDCDRLKTTRLAQKALEVVWKNLVAVTKEKA